MKVICGGFKAQPLPDGMIELVIFSQAKPIKVSDVIAAAAEHAPSLLMDGPAVEPGGAGDHLLDRAQVAGVLGVSTRTVTNLQRRRSHPLVFSKSTGRPRMWASVFKAWLAKDPRHGAVLRSGKLAALFGFPGTRASAPSTQSLTHEVSGPGQLSPVSSSPEVASTPPEELPPLASLVA